MSESETHTRRGAATGLDEHAARRKGWGLTAFFRTLNVLTMTGQPGETNLRKLADDAIARKSAHQKFRDSGEPIHDVEVLVQGARAALFQYPMKLNRCHVDVASAGKELLQVVRLVSGRRKEVLLQCRLDEVPEQGLVLPEEYPNKQRLVLEINRVEEGKYQVEVILDTVGETVVAGESEMNRPQARAASSMRSRLSIKDLIDGIGTLALRPAHSAVPAILSAVLIAGPAAGGVSLAPTSVGAATPAATAPADDTNDTAAGGSAPTADSATTPSEAYTNVPTGKASGKMDAVVLSFVSCAFSRADAPEDTGGNRKTNKSASPQSRDNKWVSSVQRRLAAVRRLAVRAKGRGKDDEELNRSLRKSFADLLQKNGVLAFVDDGRAGNYDAVLTLHYESVNGSAYDAAAIFASLDDAAEKNLRQYVEDCSSSTGGSGNAELQSASAKLVDTLVADLENARKSFKEAEANSATPRSGF